MSQAQAQPQAPELLGSRWMIIGFLMARSAVAQELRSQINQKAQSHSRR